jgi:hypothetical protein
MGLSHAQLTGSINPVLTEHAQRIEPVGFIASDVFPDLNKPDQETGQIKVWDTSNLEVPDDAVRAIGAESSHAADPEPTYKSYTANTYSRKILLTQREMRKAAAHGQDPEELKFSKTRKVVNQINLIREKHLADKLNTSGNYESGYSTTLTTTWPETNGDPIGDIYTGIKKLEDNGIFASHAVMDWAVWRSLERHSALLEFMKYTKAGMITPADFTIIFGLIPLVSKARYSNAGTITPVWQDSCIVCHIDTATSENSEDSDVNFGRSIITEPFTISEIDAPMKDHRGAIWIEAEQGFAHEFTCVDNVTDGDSIAGYLIDNAV